MFRFGIDLGGTKIEIIALDAAGQERYRQRAATKLLPPKFCAEWLWNVEQKLTKE